MLPDCYQEVRVARKPEMVPLRAKVALYDSGLCRRCLVVPINGTFAGWLKVDR